jgi:integrase
MTRHRKTAGVTLERRMLYGVLAREGLRLGEALRLEWSDLDLEHGTLSLDENKTDDPRTWALGLDVAERSSSGRSSPALPSACSRSSASAWTSAS